MTGKHTNACMSLGMCYVHTYMHAVYMYIAIYSYMPSDVVVAHAAFQLNRAVVVQSCSKGGKNCSETF